MYCTHYTSYIYDVCMFWVLCSLNHSYVYSETMAIIENVARSLLQRSTASRAATNATVLALQINDSMCFLFSRSKPLWCQRKVQFRSNMLHLIKITQLDYSNWMFQVSNFHWNIHGHIIQNECMIVRIPLPSSVLVIFPNRCEANSYADPYDEAHHAGCKLLSKDLWM